MYVLVLQSPQSSETSSSINSLDQTLRVRIGGHLPKGMLGQSQSSSSQGPPVGASGVHPNHFYQANNNNMNRDYNSSGMSTGFIGNGGQQQQ